MKKIIALALALIMALSMSVVAFAADPAIADSFTYDPAVGMKLTDTARPGNTYALSIAGPFGLSTAKTDANYVGNYKLSSDFTTEELCGANMIESVKLSKDKANVLVTLKESYTMAEDDAKAVLGEITFTLKSNSATKITVPVSFGVNNEVTSISGDKKAADATTDVTPKGNNVYVMDEDGGYVNVKVDSELFGTKKVAADAKFYFDVLPYTTKTAAGYDTKGAIDEALGDDFDGIVEYYIFDAKGLGEVDFQYDAYEDDPHFFYQFDGEKLTAIDAKYDADEDVDNYVFTAKVEGAIIVSDTEVVLAAEEETKNPDTGANDVVGVAAALAVVSLVAAGAVSLKK